MCNLREEKSVQALENWTVCSGCRQAVVQESMTVVSDIRGFILIIVLDATSISVGGLLPV
jgi:hypothetical protein